MWPMAVPSPHEKYRGQKTKIIKPNMNKISFSCMCAASAVHMCPTVDTLIIPALAIGFSPAEAEHLYECCRSIYRSSKEERMNR